jgi:hypothetical protein
VAVSDARAAYARYEGSTDSTVAPTPSWTNLRYRRRASSRDGPKWLSSPSTASQLGGGASPMIARWLLQDHCSGASPIPARTGFQDDIPRIREEMRVPIDRQSQL